MKHLKLFQEKLRDETYLSAIKKFNKLGHSNRANRMEDFLSNKKFNSFKEFGEFNIWIKEYPTDPAYGKLISSVPLQAYLTNILFDPVEFNVLLSEGSSYPFYLSFYFKIKKLDRIYDKSMETFSEYYDNEGHGTELFSIMPEMIKKGIKNIPIGEPEIFSTHHEFKGKFADRKSAVKFKKILNKALDNEIEVYSKDEDGDNVSLKSSIIQNLTSDESKRFGFDYSLYDANDFINNIKSINTNLLYSENGS